MTSRVCRRSKPSNGSSISSKRLRRDQRERQHEPAAVAFRQRADALAQNRREAERADRFRRDACGPAIGGREEFDHARNVLVLPGAQAVRQVEHELATVRQGRGRAAPENVAAVRGQQAGDRFQQAWSCPRRWVRSGRAPRRHSPQTKRRRAHAARRTAWSRRRPPSVPARAPPCGRAGWRSIRSSPHLVSPNKKDEPDDVFVLVGLVRAQRDRKRAACMVQDDIAGDERSPASRPAFAEAGLDVMQGRLLAPSRRLPRWRASANCRYRSPARRASNPSNR